LVYKATEIVASSFGASDGLLPVTLPTNIMSLQLMQTDQEPEPLFAGIDVGAEELILVIRKNGTPYFPANSCSA
jgi:hypothetical protein